MNKNIAQATRPMTGESGTFTAARNGSGRGKGLRNGAGDAR